MKCAGSVSSFGSERTRELQEVAHDVLETLDLVRDDGGVFLARARFGELRAQREKPQFDRGERIADFVRHAGGEHAEGGEFFLPRRALVRLDELAAQWRDETPVNEDARSRAEREQPGERAEDDRLEPAKGLPQLFAPLPARLAVCRRESRAEIEQRLRGLRRFFERVEDEAEIVGLLGRGDDVSRRGEEDIVGAIDLREHFALGWRGERGLALIEPLVELQALLLEALALDCRLARPEADQRVIHAEDLCLENVGDMEAAELFLVNVPRQFLELPPARARCPRDDRRHDDDGGGQREQARADGGTIGHCGLVS